MEGTPARNIFVAKLLLAVWDVTKSDFLLIVFSELSCLGYT